MSPISACAGACFVPDTTAKCQQGLPVKGSPHLETPGTYSGTWSPPGLRQATQLAVFGRPCATGCSGAHRGQAVGAPVRGVRGGGPGRRRLLRRVHHGLRVVLHHYQVLGPDLVQCVVVLPRHCTVFIYQQCWQRRHWHTASAMPGCWQVPASSLEPWTHTSL